MQSQKISRRKALTGAGAVASALAIATPALASTPKASSQAMALWNEWGAAKHGVGVAIDGPNEQQAILRWEQAEEAIINLSDATPASAIVKLAVSVDWMDNCGAEGDEAAVLSAYNELKAITGLDPIAELNRA